jgi:hypothetical protein
VKKEPEGTPFWGSTGYIFTNDNDEMGPHHWPNRATLEFYDLLKSKGLAR